MRVTKNEEYGVRLTVRLAETARQLTVRQLAEEEQLPEATVAKVIARLRKHGIVVASRGRNGGYSLAETAHEVTVARVVEACGSGLFDQEFCTRMTPVGECAHSSRCGLRPMWRGLTEVIGNFLSQITVADLVQSRRAASRGPHHTFPISLTPSPGR